jgi:hypothetical protein
MTRDKWAYLGSLLLPLGFLPLLAPRRALPALFTIGVNLLSGLPAAFSIVDSHYSALALPGLVAGAIVGAGRLRGWLTARHPRAAQTVPSALLIAAPLVGTALWGAMPGARGYHAEDYERSERAAILERLTAPVDGTASVSLQPDLLAHFARRPRLFLFPFGLSEVDFALCDLSRFSSGPHREGARRRVAAAVQNGMRIEAQEGPILLLRRTPR